MANTNTDAKKANFFTKAIDFVKGLAIKIGRSFKEMYAELKKVTWPQRGDLINTTALVIGFLVAMGIVIFVIDAGASALIRLITQ